MGEGLVLPIRNPFAIFQLGYTRNFSGNSVAYWSETMSFKQSILARVSPLASFNQVDVLPMYTHESTAILMA